LYHVIPLDRNSRQKFDLFGFQFMVQYIRTTEAAFNDTSGTHKGATHSSEVVRAQISLYL